MSSREKQKKKPVYDITVRPINSSMISSIEELVGRFIDNTNKPNPTILNETQDNPISSQNLPPITQTPPIIETSPITQTEEPMSNRHLLPPVTQTPPISLIEVKGNLSLPNTIMDSLLPQLEPYEQLIYLRLFRLSHGFRKDTCLVGMEKLAKSCHISLSTTIRTIKELEKKGLIRKLDIKLGGKMTEIRGNIFWVFNPSVIQAPSVTQTPPVTQKAPTTQTPIKDHHDDLKKHDHHQSEHEKSVMMIYQTVTQNSWTKADIATYQKIKNVPIDKIEIAIRLATQRASSRPNSLAFFSKEILSVASPKTNRSKQKKAMQKIIEQIKNSKVGSSYSISDLSYWVKEACLRNDITYDTDLFDELTT